MPKDDLTDLTEPNDDPAKGNGDGDPGQRWTPKKIKVRGQEMIVDSEEKALELMQKGARFEEGQRMTKEERKALDKEKADLQQWLNEAAPLIEADKILRSDPVKRAKVNAILQGKPMPGDDDDLDPDDVPAIRRVRNESKEEIAELRRAIERLSNGLDSGLGSIKRDRKMDLEERDLRARFKWASDDEIEDAREYAAKKGLDLDEAFKITTFDKQAEMERDRVMKEFGGDPERFTPRRSEALTLDGIGPVTEESLQRLYDDPDLYAKYKTQIREWKRKRSGKVQVPR